MVNFLGYSMIYSGFPVFSSITGSVDTGSVDLLRLLGFVSSFIKDFLLLDCGLDLMLIFDGVGVLFTTLLVFFNFVIDGLCSII